MSGRSAIAAPQVEAAGSEAGGRALKLQTDTPHLVNIGGDRLSTSVTLHPIPQGRVTLGSGSGVDIPVHGTGVLPLHCHIENSEGVVTIYPLSENLSIDGVRIDRPTRLSQGVMLTIGRSNYMRFNHPAEAKIMKSVLPNPRISMAAINIEPETDQLYHQQELFNPQHQTQNPNRPNKQKIDRKPPAVPKKHYKLSHSQSPEDEDGTPDEDSMPSNIQMKVSKFEYLAQQHFKKSISPKVFAANSVTVNTPAKDVLGRSPPDIQSFAKSLPRNAVNYSETHWEDSKTPDRSMFGKKSPAYVNVQLQESKSINNRVVIYENGANKELNTKRNNANRAMTPSPNYNRSTSPFFRAATSPSVTSDSGDVGSTSSNEDTLTSRSADAEMRRHLAQQERMREEEMGKAEQARLEEILNICAEYENQVQIEKNKVTHNRIITNGSLPRDKRQYGGLTTPPPSPREPIDPKQQRTNSNNSSCSYPYENVTPLTTREKKYSSYENVTNSPIRQETETHRQNDAGSYENVTLIGQNQTNGQSPRTRIRTIVPSHRDNTPKEPPELTPAKPEVFDPHPSKTEANLQSSHATPKTLPTKLIVTEQASPTPTPSPATIQAPSRDVFERLQNDRETLRNRIWTLKCQMAENETQVEELRSEHKLERALITAELESKVKELVELERKRTSHTARAQQIEANMAYGQTRQAQDQQQSQQRLRKAQEHMTVIEERYNSTPKTDPNHETIFEQYLQAQESLDNEKKTFEDLEFHHLEEEADWLASREETQREIIELSNRIETIRQNLNELEQQRHSVSSSNNREIDNLLNRYQMLLAEHDKYTDSLRNVERELSTWQLFDSERDESSSSSDSDKSIYLDKMRPSRIIDMSTSLMVTDTEKIPLEHVYNMSQSFNEKLLHDKAILETGMPVKYPSQDDIDRISKVTMSAPINIDEEQGKKVIESLKDIERKRHLHLCQQGSQVIEQERQRVQALKQRVQQEVRSTWEQRRLDCSSITSIEEEITTSKEIIDTDAKAQFSPQQNPSPTQDDSSSHHHRASSEPTDSPRPMSETSEMSVEVGTYTTPTTLDSSSVAIKKRRQPTTIDKQRPLTRYLPIRDSDLDLKRHIESAGHQVVACPHLIIDRHCCRGFLHKKGAKLSGWSKRWFVFDRLKHTLTYFNDKSERKARGGAYFQAIENVYMDHQNSVKSPNPQLTFILKTHQRLYYLMAPSPEAMRIWMDVIITGAEGYQEFQRGS